MLIAKIRKSNRTGRKICSLPMAAFEYFQVTDLYHNQRWFLPGYVLSVALYDQPIS